MLLLQELSQRVLHDLNFSAMLLLVIAVVLLWLKPGRGREQTMLAVVMGIWSIPYIMAMVALACGMHIADLGGVLPVPYLVGGTFYTVLLLLVPNDLVRPGRYTIGRVLIVCLPFIAVSSLYYIGVWLLGQSCGPIESYAELKARSGEFSVWYRYVLLADLLGYVIFGAMAVLKNLPEYIRRSSEEHGGGADSGLSWLRAYTLWLAVLLVAYCGVIFIGGEWCEVINTVALMVFFIYVFFKSWNYVNPFLENDNMENDKAIADGEKAGERGERGERGSADLTDCPCGAERQFEDKIPEYRKRVEEWFDSASPYLNPEFKLLDVMTILPLNRSYLSRVFNEGFGENFSSVVRGYRLRHAERLLTTFPDLSIVEVARQSGFSSSSVFHRAFIALKGMTPVQFRNNLRQQ